MQQQRCSDEKKNVFATIKSNEKPCEISVDLIAISMRSETYNTHTQHPITCIYYCYYYYFVFISWHLKHRDITSAWIYIQLWCMPQTEQIINVKEIVIDLSVCEEWTQNVVYSDSSIVSCCIMFKVNTIHNIHARLTLLHLFHHVGHNINPEKNVRTNQFKFELKQEN